VKQNLLELSHIVHCRCWSSETPYGPRSCSKLDLFTWYEAVSAVWLQPLMHWPQVKPLICYIKRKKMTPHRA